MEIQAIVHRKRRIRRGRGFSKNELKEVNVDLKSALKLGIPIDPRRRSKHKENIEVLRRYLETLKTPEQPKDKNVKKKNTLNN